MFIEFGLCSYKLLIPLIYPIMYQIKKFGIQQEASFLYTVFMNIMSYFSAGLIYLIVLYRSKKKDTNEIDYNTNPNNSILSSFQLDNQIYFDRKIIKKKRISRKKLTIFFLALLNFVALLFENISLAKIDIDFYDNIDMLITIFFYVLFSKLILKTKIYKHQYVSFISITLCLLVFIIRNMILKKATMKKFIISFFLYLVIFGLYALFDILTKIHFNIDLNVPYHFMFFIGFFSLIMLIPFELIYYFKFDGNVDFLGKSIIKEIIENFSSRSHYFLLFIFDLFSGLIRLGGMTLTIYYFSPCHFVISQVLTQIITSSVNWIQNPDEYTSADIVLSIVLYVIIFIFSLIYNEVIIIKLCTLEENTTKYITIRETEEFDSLSKIIIDEEPVSSENCNKKIKKKINNN